MCPGSYQKLASYVICCLRCFICFFKYVLEVLGVYISFLHVVYLCLCSLPARFFIINNKLFTYLLTYLQSRIPILLEDQLRDFGVATGEGSTLSRASWRLDVGRSCR